jgi:hypothetical protein
MIVPIPNDSLKKDKPSAIKTTSFVTLEKSTLKRNFIPSSAPGKNIALISQTIMRISKIGISTLVSLSIPFFTPNINIEETTIIENICHKIGEIGPVTVVSKILSIFDIDAFLNNPVIALKIYE